VKIRYQADHDLRKAIVRGTIRRNPQLDFRSAPTPDSDILALAARDGRILVSHDFQNMPVLFRRFTESQLSPGVLLISQDLVTSHAIESLVLIWEVTSPEEWQSRLCLIPSLITVATAALR
jgi:predicted nuclease of predicted toxin-antitoxin system